VKRPALAAAFLLLFLPLTLPLFVWRVFSPGDIVGFHVPMRYVYREALRAGDTFLWTSQFDSGIYIHGEGQTGMAHPLHLLAYRFLPLTAAMNLELTGAYALAACGLWLLLRRLGIDSSAACAGALTFAFGGFMLPHLNHMNAIVVAAHMPWIVLAADLLITGTAAAFGFAGVALVLGSAVLFGFPQVVWMMAVVVAWFAAFRMTTGVAPRRIALLGCALGAGLMIGGVQLLPSIDAARDSGRMLAGAEMRLSFSLHPLNLIQLFSPYALKDGIYTASRPEWFPHEFTVYAGALATMSVVWILWRWRALADRRLAAALLCLAAIGLLLALGGYGGVYPWIARLPGLSQLRASARHVLIAHFALAGLVALTLDDVMRRRAGDPPPRTWPLLIPVVLSAVATAAALVGPDWAGLPGVAAGGPKAIAGLAFAAATAWLLARAARGAPLAMSLLVLVFAADLACWGLPFAYETRPIAIGRIVPPRGLPPGIRPGDLVHTETAIEDGNKVVLSKVRTHEAYVGLVRTSVLNGEDLITQRLAGVAWRWTPTGWSPVTDTMPRARLVREWRVSEHVVRDLATIDIARTALVDASPGSTDAPTGVATMIEDRPGRMRIETSAAAPQLLVLTERHHRGWIARVDASDTSVRRVYGDYLGCVVPAGTHTVSFVFAPASARYGLWVTLAGIALTIAGALVIRRVDRRI
jgi:hypothetical protein